MVTVEKRGQPLTLVAFAGMALQHEMLEWVKTAEQLPVNYVGVADPHRAWYQIDTEKIADDVRQALWDCKADKSLFLGGSAGGFAAFLYCGLVGCTRVTAFSPQSCVGKKMRELGDDRWPRLMEKVPETRFNDVGGRYRPATVFYAGDEPLDHIHAERFTTGIKSVFSRGGHNVAHLLKEMGLLIPYLRGEISRCM